MKRIALPPWLFFALAALAGLLQAAALADPWQGQPRWWLQLISLAALTALLARQARRLPEKPQAGSHSMSPPASDARPRAARWLARLGFAGSGLVRSGFWPGFALGWFFALGWLAGTFWWLFISMHTYGGLAAPLAALAVLALAAFLALYYGVAAGLFVVWAPRSRQGLAPVRSAALLAALWTLAELARGGWLTGFPWGAGGYAHLDGPFIPLARWAGVYGLGLVATFTAAVAALMTLHESDLEERAQNLLIVFGLVSWLWWLGQEAKTASASAALPPAPVALLQGNIPQDEKFVPGTGVIDALTWYGKELARPRASLVIAPETAVPVLPDQLPEGYWPALLARYQRPGSGQAALIGVPFGDLENGYTNSVMGLAPGQTSDGYYRYDKHHLVPFGEFIPPLFHWFVRMMNIPLGDFERGPLVQPSFAWQGQRLAPNICYEDLFGEELAARFAAPDHAPTVFVNVSNIAWFGDGVAIDQHLAISRMRAIEFERPMLRATNSGATAIIEADGQISAALPRSTRGVLTGHYTGHTHLTPYARWASQAGLLPLWLLCAALALLCARLPWGRKGRKKR